MPHTHPSRSPSTLRSTASTNGKDQLAHLELTRTIARRFNDRYAPADPNFPEPDGMLGAAPPLLGVDGTKMSKSRGNANVLAVSEDETARLIRLAKTDPDQRITYEDPEHHPEVSNLVLINRHVVHWRLRRV